MVPKHEEERRGMTELAQVVTLGQILLCRLFTIRVLLRHERVAQIQMKIRSVGEDVR